ncbi:MAG TPA: hypothetical protein VNU94_07675 [Acidobacteriaceae bacterium]|nr:hypothetical protein [Acidobacteriaceae bacterium]
MLQTGTWLFAAALALPAALPAETCITQSQMATADRDALTTAVLSFAGWVKTNDAADVKTATIPEFAGNFDGIATAISATAPKIAGDALSVTSLYILDASGNSGIKDTQFFCILNNSTSEAIFSLPALPPARYALAIVHAQGDRAWTLSFVLRQASSQSGSAWLLAGFIPKLATAAGHDGIWYWTQARAYAKQNQHWNAWLYYAEADALLSPVDFVSSTNRDRLHAEQESAQPAQLAANGISADHPLSAASFAFTAIGTEESLDGKSLELGVHLVATDVSDPAAVRERSMAALSALLAAYPELRGAFTGAWVYADAPGQSSFGIEFNPLPPATP